MISKSGGRVSFTIIFNQQSKSLSDQFDRITI